MDLSKLKELWDRLTVGQRVRLGVALFGTLALVWGLSIYATRVRFVPLATGLEHTDAAAIMAALEDRQVDYRLAAGGTRIDVPASGIDKLRLELGEQNLLQGGGDGYEILDGPSFGRSDGEQQVQRIRAKEGELARTIQQFDAVKTARVTLAIPEQSPFADEQQRATASVLLDLRRSNALSRRQVQAIVLQVANGVEGLEPDDVSVADTGGTLLSEPPDDGSGMSSTQLDAKRNIERGIERQVTGILERLVGAGRVRATATVTLNMRSVSRLEETYDPNVAVVLQESKDKSVQTGGRTAAAGVPGTASNTPGGSGGANASGGSNRQESQVTETTFGVNKTVAEVNEPVGQLVKQSVAVLVDHATATPDGGGQPVPTPRSDEEMSRIRTLVESAIGFDADRGDMLTVQNFPFDDTELALPAAGGGLNMQTLVPIARYLSVPLAVLLFALFVLRPAIGTLRAVSAEAADDVIPPTVARLQEALRSGAAGQIAGEAVPLRRRLMDVATEDPRAAALVVRNWLTVDDGEA